MNIVAFDVSKNELVGVKVNKRGQVKEKYKISNSIESDVNYLKTSSNSKTILGCEATGEYHNILVKECLNQNVNCYILNPIITKQFTRATVRKKKTDLTDAIVIAKCLLQGEGEKATVSDFNPAKRILRTSTELSKLTVSVSHMKKGFQEHWSEQVEIQQELDKLHKFIESSMKTIRKYGLEQIDPNLVKLLCSIPGVGKTTASTFITEIGDINRFPNIKSLVAYAGLDPKVRQSGISLNRNTKITKRGSPYLRRSLFISASIAQRCDDELKHYYLKKRSEGKRFREATVANARHILQRVYAVWKRQTPYVIHR